MSRTEASLKTRQQRIVMCLERTLPTERRKLEPMRARARALPAMLRRHGPLQVVLFLAAKGAGSEGATADGELAGHLLAGVDAALGGKELPIQDPEDYARHHLSGLSLVAYLLHWEAAIEAASWLKLLVEARCPAQVNSTAKDAKPGEDEA